MAKREEKRRDEKWEGLKRRVQLLARLDEAPIVLEGGLHVAEIERVADPERVIKRLREHGRLDRATFEGAVETARPALSISTAVLSTAGRDLRALAVAPARAMAREHKKFLARFGTIDAAWLAHKQARGAALAARLGQPMERAKEAWFEGVFEIARAVHGDASVARLAEARGRLTALGAERRRKAKERLEIVIAGIDRGPISQDPELAALTARLERAGELPGRARRKVVLEVLRAAADFAEAPPMVTRVVGEPLRDRSFADAVRDAARALLAELPAARDPEAREKVLDLLAYYGLLFGIGDDGVPILSHKDVVRALEKKGDAAALASAKITFAQALAIVELPVARPARVRIATWVGDGLELELVVKACAAKHGGELSRCPNVKAARSYATWITRLVPHYQALGVKFELSPEFFANLPRNEDLAVLAVCLMEQTKGAEKPDPASVLDATLGLFQKLPTKASSVLARFRGTDPGAGRRAHPEFADWFGDDTTLDRYVHIAHMAGASVLTKQLREDFDHADKTAHEREHLEAMTTRSVRQEARLTALRRGERTAESAPRARTRRRIGERIDELLPIAYRRELDEAFREIIRDAWGLVVPSLTPAWRDAVRFWLVVDDNREMLGRLLRAASRAPGASVKLGEAKNLAWIEKMRSRIGVDAWLAPRKDEITVNGATFTIAVEDDPLEVLRMGIPFGTCLALESGCNAASTVVNALEANKRVIYVRSREGKIVGRKLIAITKDHRLVGYNVYIATGGPESTAIRIAIDRMCRAIADEARLPLTNSGVPEGILGGFWYDDGPVPFGDDADVAAYCASLGLRPPSKWYDAIASEARGWTAVRNGDADGALAVLTRWDRGPANAGIGAWLVERWGPRDAERRADDDNSLVRPILVHRLVDEDAMIRTLGTANRLEEWGAAQTVPTLLARFVPSLKLARAVADMAVRAVKVHPTSSDDGLAHVSFTELPLLLVGPMEEIFDVLDRVDPAWAQVVVAASSCEPCHRSAVERAGDAVLAAYEAAPDADAVTSCLADRRRSATAHACALRIAARHPMPGGPRALVRLARVRSSLVDSPDFMVAHLVQNGITAIDDAVERTAPRSATPPFEELGARLLTIEGIGRLLGKWPTVDVDKWIPGPWELAYYRRRPRVDLRVRLRERAIEAGGRPTRATELLALLGEVELLRSIPRDPKKATAANPVLPRSWGTHLAQVHGADAIAAQVAAADRGEVVAPAATVVDRLLVDVAIARFAVEADHEAIEEILLAADPTLPYAAISLAAPSAIAKKLLETKVKGAIPAPLVVRLWQRHDIRGDVASALARLTPDDWSARVWGYERVAEKMGLDVGDLFEAWAHALLERGSSSELAQTETPDQLRAVISHVVRNEKPFHVAALYDSLVDEESASWLLRAVGREPRDRVAAIRDDVKRLSHEGGRRAARKEWMEATRLQKSRRSSIEPG